MREYWKEILILLIIKVILLSIIWFYAFRDPIKPTKAEIANHLFGEPVKKS